MNKIVFALVIALFLSGCQTNQLGNILSQSDGKPTYNIFFDQADHIRELLDGNKVLEASEIYNNEKMFFVDKGNAHNDLLFSLKGKIQKVYHPKLKAETVFLSELNWPAAEGDWPSINERLKSVSKLIEEAEEQSILLLNSADQEILRTQSQLEQIKSEIRNSAGSLFLARDLTLAPRMDENFPIAIDMRQIFESNKLYVLGLISNFSLEQMEIFHSVNRAVLPGEILKQFGATYIASVQAAERKKGKSAVSALFSALQYAKVNEIEIAEVDSARSRIRIVDISNRNLVEAGQIQFGVNIERDLPLMVTTALLDDAFTDRSITGADVLILIDVAAARFNRKINGYIAVGSEFQIGTRTVPNPAYSSAQNNVTMAQSNLNAAQMRQMQAGNQPCVGLGCLAQGIAKGIAAAVTSKKRDLLQTAMSDLQATPMMLEEPVYKNYQFRKADIEATKLGSVHYYVIDKLENAFVKGTFDFTEKKSFLVAYDVHESDRNKSKNLDGTDLEADVAKFEAETVAVNLSDIIGEYASEKTKPQKLQSLVEIRRDIVADKNLSVTEYRKNRVKEVDTRAESKLMQSVVIVSNPSGGLGAGFYILDDTILTNYHVVSESKFVEITLKDGTETFGKVVAKDIRLDLALIKVQHRGVPVTLKGNYEVPIGETVIAIGHPKGLKFSVTRGVLSATRKLPALNAPGGNKITVLQTDTPINSGNSGGPLFLKNEVIGVNTFKLVSVETEGLNFAVHISEVMNFLKSEGINILQSEAKS